jgi:hypothetical protein
VGYNSRHLEVVLGDSYVTFGRGLVLSLRKLDELGIDTTLRGVNAIGRVAGLSVNGLAGVGNVMNVDPATGRQADDPHDLIYGGRAEYRLGRYAVPAVDFAQFRYRDVNGEQDLSDVLHTEIDRPPKKLTAYSGGLELPWLGGYGSAYVEYAQQKRDFGPTEKTGTALYASATGYAGPVTALLEYKDYRDYLPIATSLEPTVYPELALNDFYNSPPTLERVQQAVLNNADVTGPRGRLDVAVTDNLTPFASMAKFTDRTYFATIYDPYGGVELRWQGARSRAVFSGGYRTERFDETERKKALVGRIFEDTTHLEYDVNQSLGGPYSIELVGLHMSHYDYKTTHYEIWYEGQAYLSLKRADSWAIASGYEYFTQTPTLTRTNYVNTSVSWSVTNGVLLRFFAGGQRAGIKCVNGVCRNYPAFEGARLELLAKY